MQSAFPGSVVVELRPEGLVGGFTEAVGGKVQWDGEVLVLLGGGSQPLLAMFCEVVMCQKRHSEWNVRLGWGKVAVLEIMCSARLRPGSSRFEAILQVCAAAAAELFGSFEGGGGVLCEIA